MTRDFLSKAQVQTFQPLLVPISVSFLAGLLIAVGIEMEPSRPRTPTAPDRGRRWWLRRRKLGPATTVASPMGEFPKIATPPPKIEPRVPDRPRPKLAASTREPIGAALDFLHDGLEITAGPRTEMADAFIRYTAWCKAQSLRPLDVAEFVEEIERLCKQFGIRIAAEGDHHYLIDVQLAINVAHRQDAVT